ncbi:response regulator [bacterium]|nr:response regulator [bacterium]
MVDSSNISILVVDDERFILDSLTGFLEDYDFQVSRAESAEEALEVLKEKTFQVAVIDLRLPGMSGDLLIQNINKQYPQIRFVIHTGSVGYVLSEDLKSIGMKLNHVFFKPMPDLTVLVETILTLVNNNDE